LLKRVQILGTTPDSKPSSVGEMTVGELQGLIKAAVSLAVATAKSENAQADYGNILSAANGAATSLSQGFKEAKRISDEPREDWRKNVLWVDDRPNNNEYERRVFEELADIQFTLALSTKEALEILSKRRFGVIISDMGRKEGPREGYVLLDALRGRGDSTPFFIYADLTRRITNAKLRNMAAKVAQTDQTN
jgi:CheY-like chemotaxis protein